jgi:hypothetical protein
MADEEEDMMIVRRTSRACLISIFLPTVLKEIDAYVPQYITLQSTRPPSRHNLAKKEKSVPN